MRGREEETARKKKGIYMRDERKHTMKKTDNITTHDKEQGKKRGQKERMTRARERGDDKEEKGYIHAR